MVALDEIHRVLFIDSGSSSTADKFQSGFDVTWHSILFYLSPLQEFNMQLCVVVMYFILLISWTNLLIFEWERVYKQKHFVW